MKFCYRSSRGTLWTPILLGAFLCICLIHTTSGDDSKHPKSPDSSEEARKKSKNEVDLVKFSEHEDAVLKSIRPASGPLVSCTVSKRYPSSISSVFVVRFLYVIASDNFRLIILSALSSGKSLTPDHWPLPSPILLLTG